MKSQPGHQQMNLPTEHELAALAEFDTPTICNALEVVMPEVRKIRNGQ